MCGLNFTHPVSVPTSVFCSFDNYIVSFDDIFPLQRKIKIYIGNGFFFCSPKTLTFAFSRNAKKLACCLENVQLCFSGGILTTSVPTSHSSLL